jgi:tRNA G18 (ribose-2'-O)-methylase SpoU
MVKKVYIDSVNLPELVYYRTLRQPVEHLRNGIFIAEGEKVVKRLLESDIEIISALMTPEWHEIYRECFDNKDGQITVYVGKKELLEEIVGYNLHQGIMATAKIPLPSDIESVLSRSTSPRLFVAMDGLTNSENIGVLVRNCAAFGVQCILVGETSSSPFLRRAVRNSMGAVFKIPVVYCKTLVETLMQLRNLYSFSVIAAHPHAEEMSVIKTSFLKDCCIVFGSEGEGISAAVLSACDVHSAIPMQLGVDSLNVASASAIFLYEVFRQRNK